jgi:hypothetical protein
MSSVNPAYLAIICLKFIRILEEGELNVSQKCKIYDNFNLLVPAYIMSSVKHALGSRFFMPAVVQS